MPLSKPPAHIVNTSDQRLDGLHVLEISQVLTGAYCGMLLADLGADVIKVERPLGGDPSRSYGPPFVEDDAYYFWSVNRNKRSICLDLKDAENQALLKKLAKKADVVVHNYLPSQAAALGFSYEQVADEENPLVYCSITGFDSAGPYADKASLDIVLQAITGAMSITGEAGGLPIRSPIPMADLSAALHATTAILAALFNRERSRLGERIEVSLDQSLAAVMPYHWADVFLTTNEPQRLGNAHPAIVPYNCYAASDGHVVLTASSDDAWQKLCRALQADELLSDPRLKANAGRVAHRELVDTQIQAALRQRSCDEIVGRLDQYNIPSSKVCSLTEAARFLRAWQIESATSKQSIPVMAPPYRFHSESTPRMRRPPRLGEHTQEVLEEFQLVAAKNPRAG